MPVPFLQPDEKKFLETVAQMTYCNPFLPVRIELERAALGRDFTEIDPAWNTQIKRYSDHPNLVKLLERVEKTAEALRGRLAGSKSISQSEFELYEELVVFTLYHRYFDSFHGLIASENEGTNRKIDFYAPFKRDAESFLLPSGRPSRTLAELPHVFACFFQIRRAFHHIFSYIVGVSRPLIALRAAVWESIFSHDLRRYRRCLFNRMGDVVTLITGPSGTGKELVARAVGMSRYIPFDPEGRKFGVDFAASFYPLNLSALSPTLVEAELFGHRRGAFTGATENRAGWFEVCPSLGTVFLDEIGEIERALQVKLLRVIETRAFHRLGETEPRRFLGKIIAATNRDLSTEMRDGRFRRDFYYRLCSDIIETPRLADQLADQPDDLEHLVRFLAARMMDKNEAHEFSREVVVWIDKHLGKDYPWPGNIRELEQCTRNLLIRGKYVPADAEPSAPADALAADIRDGALSSDELLARYTTYLYARLQSYREVARRLGVDHRTVKGRIDEKLLAKIRKNDE